MSRYLFFYLFSQLCGFFLGTVLSFSLRSFAPPFSLFLSLLAIMRFFSPRKLAVPSISLYDYNVLFSSPDMTLLLFFFFLRIEDASSAVFSLEGAFRESRLRKYPHRGERHDGRGRKEKYECPCRVHAILKGFPFTGSVSDLRRARARVSIAVAIPPGRLAKVTD